MADANIDFRPSTRLQHFDYRSARAYFVTMCLTDRICAFGEISGDVVALSRRGLVARDCWLDIPNHHPHVELGEFVVMPNHVHGILLFTGDAPPPVVATPASRPSLATGPDAGSLGAVVGSYKSAVTRMINRLRPGAAANLWQRNFYDHVVRNERSHERIREYIRLNPARWRHDGENPSGDGVDDLVAFVQSLQVTADSSLRDDRDAGVATTKGQP